MRKLLFIVFGLILLFGQALLGNIINIPDDYPTIQQGIDASVNGDTVLVQLGTYVENINYNGKNITVASLFYTTQDTSYISQTIIDGDSVDTVVKFENGEDSTAVLTGFTITNGQGGGSFPNYTGGGITCINSSTPSLENVTITGNIANVDGGGIYCSSSSPSLENVTITGNSADMGGGICCRGNSSPSLQYVTIIGNSADGSGGGIFCSHSSPSLQNVTITCNNAHDGGGIFCCFDSSPSLENVTITGNSANYGGGGICCYWNSSPSLDNITITSNIANYYGGGIYCDVNSSPSLENVTITGNSAGYGGGIFCRDNSSPSLENVTITGNSAGYGYGGGIFCRGNSSPSLVNSIVSDNTGNYGIYVYSGNPTLTYSDFYNNQVGNFYGVNDSIGVNVTTNANGDSCDVFYNIQLDPLFVDPENGDYHLSWANFPIPDSTMSPCIDAGDPNSPLDPDSTIADMGAYYFNQSFSVDDPPEISNYMIINYPNPFKNSTYFSFHITKSTQVVIDIYNIKGQHIQRLLDEYKNHGSYLIECSAKDLTSGIYFYKMEINNDEIFTGKMVLLR
ncbi:MAG: right-handed parallel beta-helix repeat-containing protein [Candidatus Cloacimonetes bacterium]|nr:right-handed parallel beta-helix repeat-containing protein [Candidatus Cloacimonadota bacterium]